MRNTAPSGASCLVMVCALVSLGSIFAVGRAIAQQPAKAGDVSWTFDKRLTELETRVAVLEGRATGSKKLAEAQGPFDLGSTPLVVPLKPVKATASACKCESSPCADGRCQAYGGAGNCGCTIAAVTATAGHQMVFDGVPHVCGSDNVYRPVASSRASPAEPVYATFRPPVFQNFTPVRFVGAGCANGACGVPTR